MALRSYTGRYENGQIVLNEPPTDVRVAEVVVTFLKVEEGGGETREEAIAALMEFARRPKPQGGPPLSREEANARD